MLLQLQLRLPKVVGWVLGVWHHPQLPVRVLLSAPYAAPPLQRWLLLLLLLGTVTNCVRLQHGGQYLHGTINHGLAHADRLVLGLLLSFQLQLLQEMLPRRQCRCRQHIPHPRRGSCEV